MSLTAEERRILRQLEGNLAHARKVRAGWRVMRAMFRSGCDTARGGGGMRPRCPWCGRLKGLDAFSGRGGAGVGYQRAGFCMDAVDTDAAHLAAYPFDCVGGKAICTDAVVFIAEHGWGYAFIHTSPTCTGYSQGTSMLPDRLSRYDRLIGVTREALLIAGAPYVIENVVSKDTRAELRDPTMLCWTEFYEPGSVTDTHACDHCEAGVPLWTRRHRLFETSFSMSRTRGGCRHPQGMQCAGAYGAARRCPWEARHVRKGGYVPTDITVLQRLLDIDWVDDEAALFLAIPPAYTEHVGGQILSHLSAVAA
jgi:DNA (cytosine-5)-methyltransferase 1